MGCVLTRDEEVQLRGMSNCPSILGLDALASKPINRQSWSENLLTSSGTYSELNPKQQLEPAKIWKPTESLDLAAVGLREASSDADLQGFRPIKGAVQLRPTSPLCVWWRGPTARPARWTCSKKL